ncbi:hypothetical protein RhiirA4_410252, partial [Rhizophagus irregularis]
LLFSIFIILFILGLYWDAWSTTFFGLGTIKYISKDLFLEQRNLKNGLLCFLHTMLLVLKN